MPIGSASSIMLAGWPSADKTFGFRHPAALHQQSLRRHGRLRGLELSISNATDYIAYHRHLRERLGELGDELCGPISGFARLQREALQDGALARKTKELMALAIGITQHCEGCIAFHMHDAIDAGATRAEILESIGVAILMDGGPGTVYAAHALDALEQFLPVANTDNVPALPAENCA